MANTSIFVFLWIEPNFNQNKAQTEFCVYAFSDLYQEV